MPGAGKQSPEVQEHIRELLEAGFDPTTIHRRLKVGRSSIYRMKRCLQQHGTAYMPTEMNKKNGRPKVLSAGQELEVREWLRDPKNRNRYLDDLVWLIHDRFGIVCSTTTMSKLKRKWLRVIESEETGQPIDDTTRALLMETHPDLPILHQTSAPAAQMLQPLAAQKMHPSQPEPEPESQSVHHIHHQQRNEMPLATLLQQPSPNQHTDPQLQALQSQIDPRFQLSPQQHLDSQLQQQLQHELASAETSRA
ncbi:hypothetical protein LTR85_003182 [Meristemomyces frigidus]|nr:hypothetical protein LTR85_003182 [Meristemomyces frigidus]